MLIGYQRRRYQGVKRLNTGAVVVLALSGCAQAPSPSPSPAPSAAAAQADASVTNLESAIHWATCPETGLRRGDDGNTMIHNAVVAASNARAAITLGNAALFQLSQSQLTSIASLCTYEKENCGKGPAHIGMTTDQAIHTSWCYPDKKNTTETEGHFREQWIYQHSVEHRGYLYFDNGHLTAIQETP
jgi:hypothetical protein